MNLEIPEAIVQRKYTNTNLLFQLGCKKEKINANLVMIDDGYLLKGYLCKDILITNSSKRFVDYEYVLKYTDEELNENTELRWFRYRETLNPNEIKESYEENYVLRKEVIENQELKTKGLRTPQIGAIHSILSNITNPKFTNGIVVMPT